ncbi:MAG: Rhomboid protease GluP [Planctomycetes bacterium ADurb.Bin126]|nr:MAG: Rhomboid protease GluP [Planctomycetes bacterium ADurb.Bin126]HOD81252.1 rhomboid family intramembrane serine protease [Phycisphaerae bacterium]HQL71580.1 rhomboid family intramembrane serine protease [Phycisphaerae bacterium]
MQQTLLISGYKCIEGDAAAWPATVVLMVRQDDVLGVSPLELADQAVGKLTEHSDHKYKGLLLVGSRSIDEGDLRGRIESGPSTAAYLDARGGQFLLERRVSWLRQEALRPFRAHNLRRLLDPASLTAKAARIDCPATLADDVKEYQEQRAFMNRSQELSCVRWPWVSLSILGIWLAVLGGMVALAGSRTLEAVFLQWGALYGPRVAGGQWWRVISTGGVCATLGHLIFNLLSVLLLGGMLEILQGRWRVAAVFLFGVVTSSLLSLYVHPTMVSCGASSGGLALVGAAIAVGVRFGGEFPRHTRWPLVGLLAMAALLTGSSSFEKHVDWAGSLGGLIGGLALGLLIVRSPIRVAWPGAWVYPALPALAIATLLFAGYAVARVPADAPWDPKNPRAELQQKLADLQREGELRTLLEDHRRLIAALEAIHRDVHAGKRTREDGLRAFDQTLVRMRDYVRVIEARQGPPATPSAGKDGEKLQALRRLLEARLAYASLLRKDLERPSMSIAALHRARMNAQQGEMEYTETLLRAEGLDLGRSSTPGAGKGAGTSSAPPGQDKETRR